MDDRWILKNRLREIRAEKNLSQAQLAEIVGVSRNTISSIETGQFNPTAKLALVLCIALEKKFEEIFYFNKSEIVSLQMTEDVVEEKPWRPLPSKEDEKRFEPGLEAIKDKLYEEHESNIDTDVYVYIKLGEYSKDRSRIIVHTEVIEDDVSPFRPVSQEYGWYGAGVLDAESGEVVFFDSNLYYRGYTDKQNELHHGAVLDHSGKRLLDYSAGLRVRTISGEGSRICDTPENDVKELGTGEFLFADFMDDDRYVLCMDINHRVQVIDSVTGRKMIQQVYPETEYGIPFCLEGESFGIPHYGKGFRCNIIWDY